MADRLRIGRRYRHPVFGRALPCGVVNLRSATAATVLTVAFFAVVVLVRTVQPLVDGDVWWHLRAGEAVLRDGAVAMTNTWTLAGEGYPWISQDWLSNVVMSLILDIGGDLGPTLLSLFFGGIVVLAFVVLWDAVRRRHASTSTVGRVLALGAGLVVAAPVLGVRVQTIDILWIAVTVWLLWGYVADRRVRWLAALPLLAAAWANTHAAWPLLFALGGAILVGELLDRLLGRQGDGPPPLQPSELAALALALVVCIPALLLNPNGPGLLTYPFSTATITAHRDFLFEWSAPDIGTFPGQALFAFLLLVVVPTLVIGRRHLRSADALWLVGLGLMSLTAIRFVIAIGPVGAAVAAAVLAPSLARLPIVGRVQRPLAFIGRPPANARQSLLNLALAAVIGIAGVTVATLRVLPAPHRAAIAEAMPVRATEWLADAGDAARIFNVYAWGGYLGRSLPQARVYIDGRSDIYGDALIREYAESIALERDPFALLDREEIDTVVFWPGTPFADALDQSRNWDRAYSDEQAAVWTRTERQ